MVRASPSQAKPREQGASWEEATGSRCHVRTKANEVGKVWLGKYDFAERYQRRHK